MVHQSSFPSASCPSFFLRSKNLFFSFRRSHSFPLYRADVKSWLHLVNCRVFVVLFGASLWNMNGEHSRLWRCKQMETENKKMELRAEEDAERRCGVTSLLSVSLCGAESRSRRTKHADLGGKNSLRADRPHKHTNTQTQRHAVYTLTPLTPWRWTTWQLLKSQTETSWSPPGVCLQYRS